MEQDHRDANLLYVKNLANLQDSPEATMLESIATASPLKVSTPVPRMADRIPLLHSIAKKKQALAVIEL